MLVHAAAIEQVLSPSIGDTVEVSLVQLVQLVQHELEVLLPTGNPTAKRVAQRLQRSERTLHRALANHGTSFRQLLEQLREKRAREALATDATLDTIAEQLGYADVRALGRAFKRWTGSTLAAFRRTR